LDTLLREYETRTSFIDEDGNIEQGREIYYYIKGLYYIHTFRLDSAEFFFRKELRFGLDPNNQMAALIGLQKVFEHRANIDSLTKYTALFMEIADSCHTQVEMQNMLRMNALYNYTRNERIAYEKENEARVWNLRFWVIALGLIVLLLVSLIGYRSLRVTIRNYEKEKRLKSSSIVLHMKMLANSNPPRMPEISDWNALKELINKEIPSFYNKLNTERYVLTDMEYDICMLIRVHMSPTDIYKLKKCTSGYVTTLRKRLLERVYGEHGSAKDFDDKLLSIY
jgi:hypothetical protein